MARRRNRNQTIRIRSLPAQNQGWDKSTKIGLASAIASGISGFAAVTGIFLTYFALKLSYKQNDASERRYFENDTASKHQQTITRAQEAVRDTNGSIQTRTLVNMYMNAEAESKRLRERDLEQIALLRTEIKIIAEELEINRKATTPFILLGFDVKPVYQATGKLMPFEVNVGLRNVGKVAAQQTKISFFVATIDYKLNRVVQCSELDSAILIKEIKAGSTEQLPRSLGVHVLNEAPAYSNSIGKTGPPDMINSYIYIIVAKAVSTDEYASGRYEKYYTAAYERHEAGRNSYHFSVNFRSVGYALLEKYIKKYGFNYRLMLTQLGKEYSYVRSQTLNQY